MRVSVIGANGQLGTDLVKTLTVRGFEVQSLTRNQVDVTSRDSVAKALSSFTPDVVVNTAAYVSVNLAETHEADAAAVNVVGAGHVADVAVGFGARNIYISTDFIFDGQKPFGEFYEVDDIAGPLNVYGQTKYEGELAVSAVDPDALVYRISSVFGAAGSSGKGGNFIEAVLKKVRAGEVASVIDDNRMSPTYTAATANTLSELIGQGAVGVEHGSSFGYCSWYEMASYVAGKFGYEKYLMPIASDGNPKVQRPRNSVLSVAGVGKYGMSNVYWQDAVDSYLHEKGYL